MISSTYSRIRAHTQGTQPGAGVSGHLLLERLRRRMALNEQGIPERQLWLLWERKRGREESHTFDSAPKFLS